MRMQELQQSPETAGWAISLLYKFLPAGLGAAIAIMVDPPQSKRDLFARFFAAFVMSAMFGELAMELLRANVAWLSFLDPTKRSHAAAVDFIIGAFGWFVVGGLVMLATRWRNNPSVPGMPAPPSNQP